MIGLICDNVLNLIGRTPIIRLNKIEQDYCNYLYAKIEKQNPAGSSKDRISYYIIRNLLDNNLINKDTLIVEATSGNTGIGLAMVCAYYDLKLVIVMCETVTNERVKILESYGVRVILTKKEFGIEGAIEEAKKITGENNNSYYIDQFNNIDNMLCHYYTTAEEIINDFNKPLDYIMIGMGSSGTIMGIAKRIKENFETKIIGIEPSGCPYYREKRCGEYLIPGIGTTFEPGFYDNKFIDDIVCVDDKEAKKSMYEIMKKEGISVGVSSGAVLAGTLSYIMNNKLENKTILMLFPDSIEKYLSIL